MTYNIVPIQSTKYTKLYFFFIIFIEGHSHLKTYLQLIMTQSVLNRPQQWDWVGIVHVVGKSHEWLAPRGVCSGAPGRFWGSVLVVKYGHPHNPLRRRMAQVGRLQLRGQLPFPLIPSVLKPDFDLRLRQVQGRGQARPLRAAQVALDVEGGLQLEDLTPGKHRARLLLPAGLLLGVQLVRFSPPVVPLFRLFLWLIRFTFIQRDVVVGTLLLDIMVTFVEIRGAPVRGRRCLPGDGLLRPCRRHCLHFNKRDSLNPYAFYLQRQLFTSTWNWPVHFFFP